MSIYSVLRKKKEEEEASKPSSIFSVLNKQAMSQGQALDLADQQLDEMNGPAAVPTPKPEYPLLERAVGAGENLLTLLTGATSGAVGHMAGTVAGIPKAIIDGDIGTPEGVRTVRDAADTVGGLLTYEPKTGAGKEYAGEIGDFYGENLWPLEATVGYPAGQGLVQPVRTMQIRNARQSTLEGASAARATDAARREAQSQELPIPFEGEAQLTRGQLERDFEQLQFEREQAKIGATGKPLRDREAAQAEVYGKNLDDMQEAVSEGVRYGDDFEQGSVVGAKVQQQKDTDWANVGEAYNVARAQGELDSPVIMQSLPKAFFTLKEKLGHLSPEIDALIAGAKDLGMKWDSHHGEFHPTAPVDAYVKLREQVSSGLPNDRKGRLIARTLKQAIDEDLQSVDSGPLFKQAQDKARRFYDTYDDNPLMEKVTEGPAEKIFKSIKTADNERVTALRDNMIQSEGGAQQWRGIQGRFLKDLADRTLNPNVRDANGNPGVKPAELNKWITELEQSGKMDIIFDKQTQEKLYTLRDVAQDLFTTPPGSVNYSNTASALANFTSIMMEMGQFGLTGVPLPLVHAGRAWKQNKASKKLERKISNSLYPKGTANE